VAGRSFNWSDHGYNFSLQDGSVSGPMLFASIIHLARRFGIAKRTGTRMSNCLGAWRDYSTVFLAPASIGYKRVPSNAWLDHHIADILLGFREMNLLCYFYNDKTPECVVDGWPYKLRHTSCLKVDIGCRIKTGSVSVVNFKGLRSTDITAGTVVGPILTYAQYGEATRGGVSFDIDLKNPDGGEVRAKVVIYSCMKELWKNSKCKFFSKKDFEPTKTNNGMRKRIQVYKNAIRDVIDKGIEFMGEDTRIEVTFKDISIYKAFRIFHFNKVPNIVRRQISMISLNSKELFAQMFKFIEMAEADGRFAGTGNAKPAKMCFVGLIQAQLMMGMIGPANATKYQEYNMYHFNDIYDFGPRKLSNRELEEERDQLGLLQEINLTTHQIQAQRDFSKGLSVIMFTKYVEESTLAEIETLLLNNETELLDQSRRIVGLPGFWSGKEDDIYMDYARHAFLLKVIGDKDATLGYPNGLARDDLLRDPDVCLLLYCIYKLAAIKTNLRRGRPTQYFVIQMGRFGGHTRHRSSKIEVALDIFYSFAEDWVDKVRRVQKPEVFWLTYKLKAGRHADSENVNIFGGFPVAMLPDTASEILRDRFASRFGLDSVLKTRRGNNLVVFPRVDALSDEDLDHGGINDEPSEDEEA